MIFSLSALLVLVLFGGPIGVICFFVLVSALLLSLSFNLSFIQIIYTLLFLPLAAYFTGALLDRYAFKANLRPQFFSIGLFFISAAIYLISDFDLDLFLLSNSSVGVTFLFFTKALNNLFYVSAISAGVIMLIMILAELPLYFIKRSSVLNLNLEAFRPLGVLILTAVGFRYIFDFILLYLHV